MTIDPEKIADLEWQERSVAFDRAVGFRPPRDDDEFDAYIVSAWFVLANRAGITDRDLVDRWIIDFFLGRRTADPKLRPLVERLLKREVGDQEPRPFDLDGIVSEQLRRRKEGALFD